MLHFSYVFDNYTWNRDGSDYTLTDGELVPSRVPLNAFIRGPAAGGAFPEGINAPRAVTPEYFYEVCAEPTILWSEQVTERMSETAQDVLDKWTEKLQSMNERCIEIPFESWQIWSIWYVSAIYWFQLSLSYSTLVRVLGSEKILDIWPSFKNSPIITEFRWSPLVESAVIRNIKLITSSKSKAVSWDPIGKSLSPYTPIPGLLVLHIRRGDFEDHCVHLARWAAGWNGFNLFPELPDRFTPPPGGGQGNTTQENLDIYIQRCYPSIEQIVQKVEEVRRTPAGRGLKNVYVMTNGKPDWITELKKELYAIGWEKVATTQDLRLSWEQKYVGQAIDMLIGHRAQVFIGNGVSYSALSKHVDTWILTVFHSFRASRQILLCYAWLKILRHMPTDSGDQCSRKMMERFLCITTFIPRYTHTLYSFIPTFLYLYCNTKLTRTEFDELEVCD